jgi:hypothetical protein
VTGDVSIGEALVYSRVTFIVRQILLEGSSRDLVSEVPGEENPFYVM